MSRIGQILVTAFCGAILLCTSACSHDRSSIDFDESVGGVDSITSKPVNFSGSELIRFTRQGDVIPVTNLDDDLIEAVIKDHPDIFPNGSGNRQGSELRRFFDDGLKGTVTAGQVFKIGDEIAGIRIERIRPGTNGKTAIIGRAMGNGNMKGVKDVYQELINRGYRDVEIFDPSSLSGNWGARYSAAQVEWRRLTNNGAKWLNNQEIATTQLYALNREWAEMLRREGYEILDMGDIPLKAGEYTGFSPFYAIEKLIIFGGN